jgi:divalent metal cation (Fe/Co/Zn/Cd) transporter
MASVSILTRSELVRRGQRLEYFTIGYNSLEGLVSIVAGIVAGSVSLIGFGLDSLIEVTSGAALLWRFRHDLDHSRREQVERTTLRIVGGCFIALALYILYESGSTKHRSGASLASSSPPSRWW